MGLQDLHWIQVAENGAMWLAVINTEMSLQDAKQMRRSLAAQAELCSSSWFNTLFNIDIYAVDGSVECSPYSDSLQAGWCEDRVLVGVRFSVCIHTVPPSLLNIGYDSELIVAIILQVHPIRNLLQFWFVNFIPKNSTSQHF